MKLCYVIAVLVLLSGWLLPVDARASRTVRITGMTRGEIRSLPVTARPSRPGHVYGNTVRRANGR